MTDTQKLIAEAREYLDRERNVSQWPNLVSKLADALEAVAQERDRAKSGAHTLGEIVVRHIEDTLRWAGVEDQIGTNDPDQQLAWELCAEMPGRIAALTAERDHYRADLDTIQSLLDAPSDDRGITWWEWIDGGLGGSLHDDLRDILTRALKENT